MTYAGNSSDAEALLIKIDQYSVSAISTDAVKARSKGLQVCILSSCLDSFCCCFAVVTFVIKLFMSSFFFFQFCFNVTFTQDLSDEVAAKRSRFDSVLSSCELLETPFDQSQFEKDVGALKEQLKNCDQVSFS